MNYQTKVNASIRAS